MQNDSVNEFLVMVLLEHTTTVFAKSNETVVCYNNFDFLTRGEISTKFRSHCVIRVLTQFCRLHFYLF